MAKQLTSDFLIELFKLCLTNNKVIDICKKYLKYQYIPTESEKKIFKFIIETYELSGKAPTIGMLQQAYSTQLEVITILTRMKKIVIDNEQIDDIIKTLETFIIDSKFVLLYDKLGDLYNDGKKSEAIQLLSDESKEINEFKLKDSYYSTVFKDFKNRQEDRIKNQDSRGSEKLTFGIHELDDWTRGGPDKGTSVLFLARSGGGKSTGLRWMGLSNARLGRRVVHFQAEGSERECLDAYDAGWTSVSMHDIEYGNLPTSKRDKILKAQRDILATGGEIYVYASETFDSMSIDDARQILLDIEGLYGEVDLVIFDYLEIFTVNGRFTSSEASERKRREEIANKITNIAVEFNCVTATAIQANDITVDKFNNEKFHLTRSDISEFKGAVKPFSYFITFNQTNDEYDESILRLWVDKFRKYKKPNKPIYIYQSLENSRFYDSKKTLNEFYNSK